jgi:hypothetical protein
VLAGVGVAAVGVVVAWGVIVALAKAAIFILRKAFEG